MTNKIKWGLLVLVLAMTSCLSPRQITYIRDFEYDTDYPAKPAPELRVRPEDQSVRAVLLSFFQYLPLSQWRVASGRNSWSFFPSSCV